MVRLALEEEDETAGVAAGVKVGKGMKFGQGMNPFIPHEQ